MGGRNSYSASSKSIVTKQYKTIGYDGKMTYIQRIVDHPDSPVRSNSLSPINVVVNKNGSIKGIYFYKNHKVYKSIDMDDKKHPAHVHYWKNFYSERHKYFNSDRINSDHNFALSRKEKLYVRYAEQYVREHIEDFTK